MRILMAILTCLLGLASVVGAVWGLVIGVPLLAVVCFLLSAAFGVFIYHDYQYFFNKSK